MKKGFKSRHTLNILSIAQTHGADLRKRQIQFADFYEKYYALAYNFCRHRLTATDLEDVIHSAFELAWVRFDEYLTSDNQSYWFFNILKNQVGYSYKKDQKTFSLYNVVTNASSNKVAESEEIAYFQREQHEKFYEIIMQLPEKYQKVILLRLQNYSIAEISQKLQISEEAAKSRLKRASAKLMFLFKDFIDHYKK